MNTDFNVACRLYRVLDTVGLVLILFQYHYWEKCREFLPRWKRPLLSLATFFVSFSVVNFL
jgi:hypothetical protein